MSSPFGLPGWPRLIPLPQPSSLPHSSRSQPSCFTIFFVSRAALSGACLLLNVFVRARQCCAISGQLDPLLNVRRQPIQECLVPELRVLRLQHPVAFVGKNHQLRRHSLPLQRVEKLERLRVRHAVIHFAGDHQRRVPYTQSLDRKSTRLNSSHSQISYAVFCLHIRTVALIHL